MLEPDIYPLKLSAGVRDALINEGLSTIKSILECTTSDISNKIGIDLHAAQITFKGAKRVSTKMTKTPSVLNDDRLTAPAIPVEKEGMQ